jgi:hypothetical protein
MSSLPLKASTTTQSPQSSPQPSIQAEPPLRPAEEKVRILAYQKWEEAGSPLGSDERFWFEAENELIQREDF